MLKDSFIIIIIIIIILKQYLYFNPAADTNDDVDMLSWGFQMVVTMLNMLYMLKYYT